VEEVLAVDEDQGALDGGGGGWHRDKK
jgi:hypothetical protein